MNVQNILLIFMQNLINHSEIRNFLIISFFNSSDLRVVSKKNFFTVFIDIFFNEIMFTVPLKRDTHKITSVVPLREDFNEITSRVSLREEIH